MVENSFRTQIADSRGIENTGHEPASPNSPSPQLPRLTLGNRYVIGNLIAQGGMGAVYRARDQWLNREVAIKLLLDAYPSSVASIRFKNEACVTAQLQHPNIPPIYDIGSLEEFAIPSCNHHDEMENVDPTECVIHDVPGTAATRPFMAMKLIEGRTLLRLLKEEGHGSARWLGVFESMCHAVGYAHQAGFLHRDLKPANVMVGAFGEVQVMDWGLAKQITPKTDEEKDAVDSDSQEASDTASIAATLSDNTTGTILQRITSETSHASDLTQNGMIMGTPSYMSPEQARGENEILDARADVFSLGTMLCEILTGLPPLQGESSKIVAECAQGHFEAAFAQLDVCGEDPALITLARSCLSLEREKRPRDASEVANTVARLRAEAEARATQAELKQTEIKVRSAEQAKWTGLWMRSAALIVLLLLIGATIASYLAWRATSAELQTAEQLRVTQAAEQRALNEEAKTRLAYQQIQKQLSQIESTNDILFNIFHDLDVREVRKREESLENVLAKRLTEAAGQLNADVIEDRKMLVKLRQQLAISILHLGDVKVAHKIFEEDYETCNREYGQHHVKTYTALMNLAEAIEWKGEFHKALELHRRAYEGKLALLGLRNPLTLESLNFLGMMQYHLAQFKEATQTQEKCLEIRKEVLGINHRDTLVTMNNLLVAYSNDKEFDKALHLARDLNRLALEVYGADHYDTYVFHLNYASLLKNANRLAESADETESTLNRMRGRFAPDHPLMLTGMNNLATTLAIMNQTNRATALYEECHALMRKKLGDDHPTTISISLNLAGMYLRNGEHNRARSLYEALLEPMRTKLGEHHPITQNGVRSYINACFVLRDSPRMLAAMKKQGEILRKKGGSTDLAFAEEIGKWAILLNESGLFADAEAFARESLAIREQAKQTPVIVDMCRITLAESLLGQKRYTDAEPILLAGYQGLRSLNSNKPELAQLQIEKGNKLIDLYKAMGMPMKAEAIRVNLPHEPAPAPRLAAATK